VAVLGLLGAIVVALVDVFRWRPSVVVSVGGYASFAASFAAVVWRRPLVLVEFDATPGAAPARVDPFCDVGAVPRLKSTNPERTTTGAPLRDAIVRIDRRDDARRNARASAMPPIDDGRAVCGDDGVPRFTPRQRCRQPARVAVGPTN